MSKKKSKSKHEKATHPKTFKPYPLSVWLEEREPLKFTANQKNRTLLLGVFILALSSKGSLLITRGSNDGGVDTRNSL